MALAGPDITATVRGGQEKIRLRHDLSPRQMEVLLVGGVINWLRACIGAEPERTVA